MSSLTECFARFPVHHWSCLSWLISGRARRQQGNVHLAAHSVPRYANGNITMLPVRSSAPWRGRRHPRISNILSKHGKQCCAKTRAQRSLVTYLHNKESTEVKWKLSGCFNHDSFHWATGMRSLWGDIVLLWKRSRKRRSVIGFGICIIENAKGRGILYF